jgi:hypothetical protein
MNYMLPVSDAAASQFDMIVKCFTLYGGTGSRPAGAPPPRRGRARSASRTSVGDPPFGAVMSVAERRIKVGLGRFFRSLL